MTASAPRTEWTLDDLVDLPEDGSRYEILEGSLLVSPAPALPHFRAVSYLQRLLVRVAPDHYLVGQNIGVLRHVIRQTYLVPDLVVVREESLAGDGKALLPADVLLAVEVFSPSSASIDAVTKRHHYGRMGIPQYWIVDPGAKELTVLRGDAYREEVVVRAGERWETDEPFDIELDPADFC